MVPHDHPLRRPENRTRRDLRFGYRTLEALLYRGAGLPGLRRLRRLDDAGRHGVPALQRRPSLPGAGRRQGRCRQRQEPAPYRLRARDDRRGDSAPATICWRTAPRSPSTAAAAPAARSRSSSSIPTAITSSSTGASTRSAPTAARGRGTNGASRPASKRPCASRPRARTRPCTTPRCARGSRRRPTGRKVFFAGGAPLRGASCLFRHEKTRHGVARPQQKTAPKVCG